MQQTPKEEREAFRSAYELAGEHGLDAIVECPRYKRFVCALEDTEARRADDSRVERIADDPVDFLQPWGVAVSVPEADSLWFGRQVWQCVAARRVSLEEPFHEGSP